MSFPSSHHIPCQACVSHCQCTEELREMSFEPAIRKAPRFQDPFRDDFRATAQAFQKLNSFRRLLGFKNVKWNDILGELAVQRGREFTRSKRVKMPFTIRSSRFNVGVPLFDIVMYFAVEHENGKMVPVGESLWKIWNTHHRCAQSLIEPLANLAAVSVIKNDEMICFSVLISRLPPFFFLPMMRSRPTEEAKNLERWDKIMDKIGLISDSLATLDDDDGDDDKNSKEDEDRDEEEGNDEENRDREDGKHEIVGVENNDDVAEVIFDEYTDNKTKEARREKGREVSKPKTKSFQGVIHEVPLIQPPGQGISPLTGFCQNPTEDGNVEPIFEEYRTAGNDGHCGGMFGEAVLR